MEECFGELYTLPSSQGEWLDNLIERMSILRCSFEEKTENLPNGIDLSYTNLFGEQIGKEISSFSARSYLIRYLGVIKPDGTYFSYLAPVNIVIHSIDRNYTKLINKEAVESMKTILNHPHFDKCKNVGDIKEWTHLVKDLNLRLINL